MSKIRILATRPKKSEFSSSAIMKAIDADYSHVLVLHNDQIIHSVRKGLVILSDVQTFQYLQEKEIVYIFEVDLSVCEEFFKGFIKGSEGKDYSESQYIGFLSRTLARIVRNDSEKLICSEFAAQVLNLCCSGFEFENLDFVSPKDIIETLRIKARYYNAPNIKLINREDFYGSKEK